MSRALVSVLGVGVMAPLSFEAIVGPGTVAVATSGPAAPVVVVVLGLALIVTVGIVLVRQ